MRRLPLTQSRQPYFSFFRLKYFNTFLEYTLLAAPYHFLTVSYVRGISFVFSEFAGSAYLFQARIGAMFMAFLQ
jgi:hypothetical protein